MHTHRHDPVRTTSSRDPCLDQPASGGEKPPPGSTLLVVVITPAVARRCLLPRPGQFKVGRHLAQQPMDADPTVCASLQEASSLGLVSACVSRA